MRRWPLRVQIAFWSALVVALAQVVSGVATAKHFYHEDLELIDNLLSKEVKGVFSELRRLPSDFDCQHQKLASRLPAAYHRRFIEIRRAGKIVFQSGKTSAAIFAEPDLPPGYASRGLHDRYRLKVAQKNGWEVRVAFDTDLSRDSVEELLRGYYLASPFLLLITGFGGWWIARQALAPIDAVTVAAREITAEHLEQRLPVPASRDEMQRLTLVLNGMIERLERSFLQARRFSADTSHELRTPLAVVRAGLESMLSTAGLTPTQELQLVDLLDATTRLSSLSEKLLLLSRADAGYLVLDRSRFDLVESLREAMEEAEIFAAPRQIVIQGDLPERLECHADASRLLQVLRNLLENAVKYNRPGGTVRVSLRQEGDTLRLAFTNTGPGLRPDQAAQIFTRFYRGEAVGDTPGHGLGLSISREIVRAHGGQLVLESYDADAVTFVMTLPAE